MVKTSRRSATGSGPSSRGFRRANNVINDVASQASWQDLSMDVPWLHLALIFSVVYGVALLATLAPAVRASRIYPAQALRYE